MEPQFAARVTIDVYSGGSAPTGRIQADGGPEVRFDGWLQLLGALRDAIPGDTELRVDPDHAWARGWNPGALDRPADPRQPHS